MMHETTFTETPFDDPAADLVLALKYCWENKLDRGVLAEWSDPDIGPYARETTPRMVEREHLLLVLGALIEGPLEFAGAVSLKVGEYLWGTLSFNTCALIPPRQIFSLALNPREETRHVSKLQGRFLLFGWTINDTEWVQWRTRTAFWEKIDKEGKDAQPSDG